MKALYWIAKNNDKTSKIGKSSLYCIILDLISLEFVEGKLKKSMSQDGREEEKVKKYSIRLFTELILFDLILNFRFVKYI